MNYQERKIGRLESYFPSVVKFEGMGVIDYIFFDIYSSYAIDYKTNSGYFNRKYFIHDNEDDYFKFYYSIVKSIKSGKPTNIIAKETKVHEALIKYEISDLDRYFMKSVVCSNSLDYIFCVCDVGSKIHLPYNYNIKNDRVYKENIKSLI